MHIRAYQHADFDRLLSLTLRAFQPIQEGFREQLGSALFEAQNGRWRQDYREELTRLTSRELRDRFLVADSGDRAVGYAAWTLHPSPNGLRGEITLLCVDPDHHRAGAGAALVAAALDAMRVAGCVVAMVSTGGDGNHAPARALYEAAGFTALPNVFYSRVL